ncbi:MAG: prephenate dehydrogenase/arogenate dehydrogenase family protein [Pirellulales bacterium]|nr:prephenate dehydrogenase/arogenate dehydrogenase family protein [Pirellulales bacterium]
MQRLDSVAIIGVGLIGGSVGLALRDRRLAERVVGIGRRAESLAAAQNIGAVTETTLDLAAGVADAQLIVVCSPVDRIVEHVRAAAAACPPGALITDAGSTKGTIVAALDGALAREVTFVGSHPLAGSEKQGPTEAQADLFEGRLVVVTPGAHTREADRQRVAEFWESLGARVMAMSPAAHDRAVAASSHLPHLVAAALADAVPLAAHPVTAGGFRDTTRVAAGDAELWTQILLDNREAVLAALTPFEETLTALRAALAAGDRQQLKTILNRAKTKRDALGS